MRKPSTWLLIVAIFAAGVWNFTTAQQQGNPVVIYGIGPVTTITTTMPVSGTVNITGGPLSVTAGGTFPVQAATLPLPSGAATDATLAQVATGSLIGAQTEAAPTTDTASAGLNGRLQRIAQNITSLTQSLAARILGSNLVQVGTTAVDVNHGNVSAGTQRVVLPDNIIVPHNLVQVGTMAIDTNSGNKSGGTQRVTLATDQVALSVAPVMTVNAQPIMPAGFGCTPYHLAGGTAASTNANSIKTTAGTLCDLVLINVTSSVYYLKLYDTSSGSPNCATASTIKHVFPIPNASGAGGGLVRPLPTGEAYGLGIGYCVTGGGGDTDNTNAATGVYVEGSFK